MKPRILLVENDAAISKYLPELIGEKGYQCRSVASVAAALDEARRQPWHVVIVDLDVAGGNPLAVAARLRGALPTARLVALGSGELGRSHVPFDTVLPKPFFVEPLLAALPALLNHGTDGEAAQV